MQHSDVVIVGLGPTGLAAALSCASLGLSVVCVEPLVVPSPQPRAASIDDLAQRLLARHCAAVSDLIASLPVQLVSARGGLLFDVAPHVSDNGHAEVGFFFQPLLEAALQLELSRFSNVEMRLGWRATAVLEHSKGVRVTVQEDRTGAVLDLSCAFVVGCDGAASVVRRAAGLSLRGTTFTEAGSWLVVDAAMQSPHEGSVRDCVLRDRSVPQRKEQQHHTLMRGFRFVCDPARPGLDLPLPNGHARFEWVLDRDEHVPTDAVMCEWIQARGVPETVTRQLCFTRKARYVFHARQAHPRWCSASRRLLVAGDAAHLTPPMRGQGSDVRC